MSRFTFITTIFIFLFLNNRAFAKGTCDGKKLAESQKKVASFVKNLKSDKNPWFSLRNAFDKNRECMNTFETYDFGEAIRHTFILQWENLSDLSLLKAKDLKFYEFVMSGLTDETATRDDIKTILNKAKLNCPKNQETICFEIKKTGKGIHPEY